MKKILIYGLILVFSGLTVCLSQTGKKKKPQPSPQAKAEQLASSNCSAEFDDPASAEFKKCSEAIQLLEQLSAKKPRDLSILLSLGQAWENRSHDKAIEAYQHALAVDPGNATANYQLGLLLTNPEDQIRHLRSVITQEPNHPEAHGRLAQLLASTSQISEAVAEARQQIAINPDRIDVIANVTQMLAEKGHKSEAAQLVGDYLRSNLPANVKCEDSKEMIRQYADQPELQKTFAEQCPGNALSAEALRQKEPRERARLLEEAIKTGHPDASAHAELALTLLQLGQMNRAMAEINEQIKVNPLLGRDQIIAFASALRARSLLDDEIKVYQQYLLSQAPDDFVCPPVHKLLAESESKYAPLKQPFQKRCDGGQVAGNRSKKN